MPEIGSDTYPIPGPTEKILRHIWESTELTLHGCWEWIGSRTPAGYAKPIFINGHRLFVHRLTYSWFKGEIPNGYAIDHLCQNKRCVNPAHLDLVTRGENSRRAHEGKKQPFCKRGHPQTPENRKSCLRRGKRAEICLPCSRINSKESYWKRKRREEEFLKKQLEKQKKLEEQKK